MQTSTPSRWWGLVPAAGLLAVAAALYERFGVSTPHEYAMCHEPNSLTYLVWAVALLILGAGFLSAVGGFAAVHGIRPTVRRAFVHLGVVLAMLVLADGVDLYGGSVAAEAARKQSTDGCEYIVPTYRTVPGWFVP